jgi:hypothetical protein
MDGWLVGWPEGCVMEADQQLHGQLARWLARYRLRCRLGRGLHGHRSRLPGTTWMAGSLVGWKAALGYPRSCMDSWLVGWPLGCVNEAVEVAWTHVVRLLTGYMDVWPWLAGRLRYGS